MMAEPAEVVLLLPEKRRFTGQDFSASFLAKARRFKHLDRIAGETAQLQRHFQCIPASWPMAALIREADSADAGNSQWLLADPIHLQMEMRDARVMAWDNLAVSPNEWKAILSAMTDVFGAAGLELSLAPDRCLYLRATSSEVLPDFMPASDVLGCSLSEILPEDRKWAALFNECQVILYNHPLNVERQRRGQATVNGLWFWGQGVLPTVVYHFFSRIESQAADIRALVHHGRQRNGSMDAMLSDFRHKRDWAEIEKGFNPARRTVFDFSDGSQWLWQPEYRWCFWRRSSVSFS
ncbi:MAG: hypothetical protein KAZ45_02085 [Arenimonas sp.]|nr:hypothetical protein [Arenimonas sp.]